MDRDNTCLPAGSPLRSVDWRWQRIRRQCDNDERPSSRLDDAWVDRGRRLLTAWRQCGDDPARAQIVQTEPCFFGAIDLTKEEDPHRGWQVEAFLLTQEPIEQIARRTSLTPAIIECYERLCFSVRDRLAARDWIALKVLGSASCSANDLGTVWRHFGYFGGPHILEIVIAVTLRQTLPDCVQRIYGNNSREQEIRQRLACRFAVAAVMLHSARETRELVRLNRRRQRLERKDLGISHASEDEWLAIQAMCHALIDGRQRTPAGGEPDCSPATLTRGNHSTDCGNKRRLRRRTISARS